MTKIFHFLKREIILAAAWLLAIVSACFVPPSPDYLSYIDFHTLCLLFALMCVMAGFQESGLFSHIAVGLIGRMKTIRQLELVLILLCFFSSMIMTNDVALITFVPLAVSTLRLAGEERLLIPVVVMQTIAANLGSMATPIGNPQNLFLYTKSGISVVSFLKCMLPYTMAALLLILLWLLVQKNRTMIFQTPAEQPLNRKSLLVYSVLFFVCLTAVAKVLPTPVAALILLIVALVYDRKILRRVDYSLLLTFVGFFLFIGNMGKIPAFSHFISNAFVGHEVITAVLISQCISNVPAALLLSGFTDQYKLLMIGTNLGGLGTLIASMASLISYKYLAQALPEKKAKYMIYFTFANLVFLSFMLAVYFFV